MSGKVCDLCGKKIKNPRHGNQKYHHTIQPGMEESCRDIAKKMKANDRQKKYYWKWKDILKSESKKYIGGRTISPHAKDDFDEELRIVRNHKNKILGRRD